MPQEEEKGYTYAPHDCWHCPHHHLNPKYTYSKCATCNRILVFRWRSIWDRLRNLI